MDLIVLTQEEIELITGRKRHSAQCRVLDAMNWIYRPRLCDGFPLVAREYFNQEFGVTSNKPVAETRTKPNVEALREYLNRNKSKKRT